MSLLEGSDRNQLQFFALEEVISADNPVRVIDALVDSFDLEALGFIITGKSSEGREAYGTPTLLKLYLYGYLNRIRSSRKLETECIRNIELWWLLKQLKPKYKTIADFRKNNTKALVSTFKQFSRFLNGEDLYGRKTIAVDGSKFRAQNSKKKNFNAGKIKRQKTYILEKSEEYMSRLEEADSDEERRNLELKLQKQEDRFLRYTELENELQEGEQRQISTSDPDARALPKHMGIVEVGYNIQSAVDAKHGLVAHFEVTNEKDDHALFSPSAGAKEAFGLKKEDSLRVLADKGYHTGSEIKKCTNENIETYVAERRRSDKKAEGFKKKDFLYVSEKDEYICPQGQHLTSNGNWYIKNRGKGRTQYRVKVYKLPFHVCNACPNSLVCSGAANLKNSKGRPIERSEYDEVLEANHKRLKRNPGVYKRRQAIVEHPFGTIKRQWGYDHTLLKGKEKVSADFALIFTCYNLRRAISILGVKALTERLKSLFLKILMMSRLTVNHRRIPFNQLHNKPQRTAAA